MDSVTAYNLGQQVAINAVAFLAEDKAGMFATFSACLRFIELVRGLKLKEAVDEPLPMVQAEHDAGEKAHDF